MLSRAPRSRRIWLAAVVVISSQGCSDYFCPKKEIHLIPSGYVGPVFVVFDSPMGVPIDTDENGDYVFRIPSSGVLLLREPRQDCSWVEVRFYYVSPDGRRDRLLDRGDTPTRQVFLQVNGAVGGGGSRELRWYSYIVGVPSEELVRAREKMREAVIAKARGDVE